MPGERLFRSAPYLKTTDPWRSCARGGPALLCQQHIFTRTPRDRRGPAGAGVLQGERSDAFEDCRRAARRRFISSRQSGRSRPVSRPGSGRRRAAARRRCRCFRRTTGGTRTSRRRRSTPTRRASSRSSTTAARATCIPTSAARRRRAAWTIYGMPYAIVDGTQPKLAVTLRLLGRERRRRITRPGRASRSIRFPRRRSPSRTGSKAARQATSISAARSDRHLLVIDCTNRYLYELYNVFYDATHSQWYAGSGAFFDMKTNNRRPDGWTSADAAGLAILPGLVRYDEAWNPAVTDIGHAFRVTVRATNGYVYPASHRAGSTVGALPMGARLRLKTNVGGADPALRTSDPNVQKIFRAMQKYGLIVADNGSRHVHHRDVRHALEQRHPQSGILAAHRERLRRRPARLEAGERCASARFDQRESESGGRRQPVDRHRDAGRARAGQRRGRGVVEREQHRQSFPRASRSGRAQARRTSRSRHRALLRRT